MKTYANITLNNGDIQYNVFNLMFLKLSNEEVLKNDSDVLTVLS